MTVRNCVARALVLLALLMSSAAFAQPYDYHVYIDSDLRASTGCTVSAGGQTFEGADYRLTATVSGNPPVVTARTLTPCSGGSFGAGGALGANYPVGLNNGVPLSGGNFADVIELSLARAQMPGVQPLVRIGFGAASASGSVDVLYTANGVVGGPPMVVGTPAVIPTIGFFAGLLLALALAALALRTLKHNRRLAQMLLVGAFFSAGFAAWAANFIDDGQVGDWAGVSPVGMDAIGDSVPNLSATDIVAAFAADENRTLHFRIDVVDAENRPPLAVGDAYTTLEDTVLNIAAPGVLANDSDPDGNPITAQLVSGPTRGTLTLNANGSFSYTPNANVNGSDSFTYNAHDGQVTSLNPATVTIAITPVNDVPVFTAGPNQTVLEDAGAQTVNPWATGIDDGDPEVTQNLSFEITANSNAALFSVAPTVSPAGALSYTPAANANGSATITVRLNDDGGTANGGVSQSATQTFTITVTAVNDAPGFTAGANQTVNEDAGAQVVDPWATAISAGPPDESGQAVSFEITNNSNATLFSAAPAVSPTGVLSYTPAANANGAATITLRARDDGGTTNGGVDASAPQTFTITVNAINDAPSFTVGPNQTVNEDAGAQVVNPWATALNDGDPEVTQALSFVITNNSNAALFSAVPSVSPTGALSYTPAANANGSATITLRIQDDGSSTPPNVNTSATQTFTITVNAVNDAPTLTAVSPPTVNEDAGAQTVANWAAFNPGPPDEAGQTVLGYQISAISNAALFAVPPAVTNNGTLTYTPAANANGSSTFVARVQDSGGTANGGVDLSVVQTFTITVTAINDVPSFTVGPNQTINEDAGPQTVSPWATAINDGDPEVTQLLAFTVTANTNPALFSAAPSVSPTGALSYTPAANANGSATITLRLQDDGSNTPPNVNTSATQTFTITVTPVNDAPSFIKGADQVVAEDAPAQTANPWATAISPGPADEAGQTLTFNVTGNTNAALFSAAPAVSPTGVLTYTPAANANGSATITLTLSDNGSSTPPNVNSSAAQSFTITVNAVNDAPVNTVPGAQTTGDTVPLVFITANTNALSVADIDAAAGIVQMSFGTGAAANGTLTLANPGSVLTSLSGNGTQQVIATGTLTALNTALNGPSGSLTYTPVAGTTAARTITVITNDQGNTGSGGALIDTDTITVNVDAPPVVTSTPVNGATIANNAAITVNFSESVNVIAGITLTCGGPNLITGGATGAAVTSLNLTYTAPLPAGGCTLTVPAASVSDVDVIDPPQNPVATYTATFTVDAPPAFVSGTPAAAAVVNTAQTVSFTFNEAVTDLGSAITLNCGGAVAGAISGSGSATLTFTPTNPLPAGASCTATAIAAQIGDADALDPPQNPIANSAINFTVDAAPAFVSATPTAAAVVGTGQTVSFTFDENVADLGGAITLNCGGAVAGAITGGGSPTLTFTPTNPLTAGASCTATAVAAQIGDSDAIDPPQNPLADVVRNFTVDVAPTVTTTDPSNGATDVPLAGVVTINFSENVDLAVADFSYTCNGNPVTFAVSGSGSTSATLTPAANLPINAPCTVTALNTIGDSDLADPPNTLAANFVLSFTSVNDSAPIVSSISPSSGATTRSGTVVLINFSEFVNVAVNAVNISCAPSGAGFNGPPALISAPTLSISGVPANTGQPGDTCTVTIESTAVTDVDAIDPPNELDGNASGDTIDGDADDFVSTYLVDAAPSVTTVSPANGASNLATNATITVNFSEPVNIGAGGITLNCGAPVTFNAGPLPASNVSTITLTPSAPLPEGATCNGSVLAASIIDVDAFDPPDTMAANFSWSFTIDAAPTVTSINVANGAVVPTTQTFVVNFSENVDLTLAPIDIDCAGGIPYTGAPSLPAGATNTVTITPLGGLPAGASCTFTVQAGQVTDSDSNDPPNNLAASVVRTFTVDAAPTVTTTNPVNGAIDVGLANSLLVNFSEPVTFTASAFSLNCPTGAPIPFTVTGSGTNQATVDPTPATLPVNTLCVLTIDAAQIQDVDAADPPNAGAGITTISFTTVNDNPPTVTTNPANGAANIALNGNITVSFSEPVTLTGAWFQLNCPISGVRTSTGELSGTGISIIENTPDLVYTIDPIANLASGELCAITIDSANVVDNDAIDPPNELDGDASGDTTDGDADDYVAQFTTPDVAPTVTSTPAAGATVPNTQAVTLNFSEQVNVAAGAIAFNCGAAVTFTPALPQSGISTLTLTPSVALPNGANCTVTLESTLITDVDAIDPPNELDGNSSGDLVDGDADDFALTFSVDAQPSIVAAEVEVVNVFTALPLGVGVFADSDTNLRLSFSEAVNPTANWASLTCVTSGTQSVGGGTLAVIPADPVFTLNPATNLTPGESCTLTVFAAQVDDDDAIDPPGTLATDAVYTFAVRDAAPQVIGPTVPVNAATVPNNQVVTLNFSEVVDLAAGSIAFNCGSAVTFTPTLPVNNVSSVTLTPSAALPDGAACTVTLESTLVTDDDAIDPPDELDGDASNDTTDGDADDFVLSFNVDAAPSVLTTTPANGATNVPPTSAISIDFSESVTFSTLAEPAPGNPSFDLICDGSPAGFTLTSASPNDPVVLNPVDNDVAGRSCVLTVVAAQIADNDAIDPPNTMAANFTATIGFGAIANDDAYTVTPHLALNIPTTGVQGGGTAANDILGAGAVTGFGFAPACTGTTAGSQLDAGAANGRLTLNANGSFAYEPPAGLNAITRTFCYTVTGGDTANIVFTVQNQARVWFVDAAAAASGNGTQARPFNALTGAGSFDAVAADGDGDTIYLEGAQTGGLTLRSGQRVIGGGSTLDIATFSGVAPNAGSAFPALSGSAPMITCSGVSCLTLNSSGAANTHSLRGFAIGDSGAAGSDIAGTTFGTLTVAEMTLNGSGRALNLITGTLNGNFIDIDAASGSNQGVRLDAVGGIWTVTNRVDIGNVGATGFNITNAPAGASVTLTGGLLVNKTAAGAAVFLQTNNAGATINLGVISLTTAASAGLSVTTSPVTLTGTTGTINATGGPAIDASTATFVGGATLATVSSTGSGTTGINLNGVSGNLIMNGGAIATATGNDFDVNAGAANITYAGTITNTAARSVDITNRTGGTVTLSGAISETGTGINLTGNTGGTISFSGGVAASTGANIAFNATGGGTVNVTGTNTATTAGVAAVNIVNTNIGASNVTFRSISANGGASGIILNNTGSTGGLVVTGTGAAGTGGTIQNTTTRGASFIDARNISLSWMNFTNAATADFPAAPTGLSLGVNTADNAAIHLQNVTNVTLDRLVMNGSAEHGINGHTVRNFTLSNSTLTNLGNGADEDGLHFYNMVGTCSINNTNIASSGDDNINIQNNNNLPADLPPITTTNLTITGGSANTGVQGSGYLLGIRGTMNTTLTISGATANNNFSGGFVLDTFDTATSTIEVTGVTSTNNNDGISLSSSSGNTKFDIHDNLNLSGNDFLAINVLKAAFATGGTLDGRIRGNTITVPVGNATDAILVHNRGTGTARIAVTDNVISFGGTQIAIDLQAGQDGVSVHEVTVTGNQIAITGAATNAIAGNGILATPGGTGTTMCFDIGGNTAALRNTITHPGGSVGAGGDIRVRQRNTGPIRLPGYAGAGGDTAAVVAYLTGRNTFITAATASTNDNLYSGGGACLQPTAFP